MTEEDNIENIYKLLREVRRWDKYSELHTSLGLTNIEEFAYNLSKKYTINQK